MSSDGDEEAEAGEKEGERRKAKRRKAKRKGGDERRRGTKGEVANTEAADWREEKGEAGRLAVR